LTEPVGFLLDSNVLLDVITEDPAWAEWSATAIAQAIRSGPVFINPIVYAEVSVRFESIAELDDRMPTSTLRRAPLPFAAGFLAAKAHEAYRRRGGTRTRILPDFLIGAHAVVESLTLVTRDARRYRNAFPSLRVVAPGGVG
jgi:predicted nucleic acid-binding protein